jgi:hypothetical protein
MPKTNVTFDVVRQIGLALPEVEESTAYGALALKVRGDLLACVAVNKSAEPGSLAVRIDFEQRTALIAEAPGTYYVTDHYLSYPCVLVRLSQIQVDQMRDLLNAAWKFVTSRKKRATARPTRSATVSGGGLIRKKKSPKRSLT